MTTCQATRLHDDPPWQRDFVSHWWGVRPWRWPLAPPAGWNSKAMNLQFRYFSLNSADVRRNQRKAQLQMLSVARH